ncbi:hypothetical protein QJQ45_012623 [Haematococcus lacustris]|nr:hypothetical protein QJQ45_012623 [Haematococcus lacustris]
MVQLGMHAGRPVGMAPPGLQVFWQLACIRAAEPTKGKGKAQGKAAKAKPAPQPGRWLDRDCNAALNMQRIGESRWRPLELCYWPDQGALPAKGKEYPGLGHKRLRDKPPKAQQQQQQPAAAHRGLTLSHASIWTSCVQPDDIATASVNAWYMDDSDEDQRKPHKLDPNQPVSLSQLAQLGVLYWKLDADQHETDPKLAAIRKVRGYSYVEIISISKDTLSGYDEKLKTFYMEHIHTDEEIRFILDGQGKSAVPNRASTISVCVPCSQAMRLFVGEPIWTPYNRPQEEHASRLKYLKQFGNPNTVAVHRLEHRS